MILLTKYKPLNIPALNRRSHRLVFQALQSMRGTFLKNGLTRALILLLLFFGSCEFEPEGAYYSEVSPQTDLPEIWQIGSDADNETLYLINGADVNLRFQCSTRFLGVIVYVDNIERLKQFGEGSSDAVLSTTENGNHSFKIEFYVSSGSGSIIDCLDREGYIFERTWVAEFSSNIIHTFTTTIQDDFIIISWYT